MKTFQNKHKLTIASTPIGNISEASNRLIECLESTDILLCEDTRVAKKLFVSLAIKNKPEFIKYEKFSENSFNGKIVKWIIENKRVTLISDAGYPLISDPGYPLVNECYSNNISIEVINGPSSLMHALVLSGFSTQNFTFLGFIGKNSNERQKTLINYKNLKSTIVLFESVHRLIECINDIRTVLGNIQIAICRELTKIHEEIIRNYIDNIDLNTITLKGEFVIVINNNIEHDNIELNSIEKEIREMISKNIHTKEISQYLSNKYNLNSKEIYNLIIEIKNEK